MSICLQAAKKNPQLNAQPDRHGGLSLDPQELPAKTDPRRGTAVEAPFVLRLLLKLRIIDFLGVRIDNLTDQTPILDGQLRSEHFHSNIFRTFDNLRADAVSLTRGDLDRELLPAPSPDHIFAIGCKRRAAGEPNANHPARPNPGHYESLVHFCIRRLVILALGAGRARRLVAPLARHELYAPFVTKHPAARRALKPACARRSAIR
jgi:hypothetical protein